MVDPFPVGTASTPTADEDFLWLEGVVPADSYLRRLLHAHPPPQQIFRYAGDLPGLADALCRDWPCEPAVDEEALLFQQQLFEAAHNFAELTWATRVDLSLQVRNTLPDHAVLPEKGVGVVFSGRPAAPVFVRPDSPFVVIGDYSAAHHRTQQYSLRTAPWLLMTIGVVDDESRFTLFDMTYLCQLAAANLLIDWSILDYLVTARDTPRVLHALLEETDRSRLLALLRAGPALPPTAAAEHLRALTGNLERLGLSPALAVQENIARQITALADGRQSLPQVARGIADILQASELGPATIQLRLGLLQIAHRQPEAGLVSRPPSSEIRKNPVLG